MPLHNPNVIDFLALDSETDEIVLGITEARPWDGTDQRVYELQEKINTYLGFALGGEMLNNLPQLEGKKLRLQLDCVEEPDAKTQQCITIVNGEVGKYGMKFEVRVYPELVEEGECCGGGGGGCCGGHGHEHSHEESGCCGGHGHEHSHSHGEQDEKGECCGGHGGCGCS